MRSLRSLSIGLGLLALSALPSARAQDNATDTGVDDFAPQQSNFNISIRAERFLALLTNQNLLSSCYQVAAGADAQAMLRGCQWMYGARWPDYVAVNGSANPIGDVNNQISTLCSSQCEALTKTWESRTTAACGANTVIWDWHNTSGAFPWVAKNATINQPFPYTLAVADYAAYPMTAKDFADTMLLMTSIACPDSAGKVARTDTTSCAVENSIKIRGYNVKNIVPRFLSNPFQNCGPCMSQLMSQLDAAKTTVKALGRYQGVISTGKRTVEARCRPTGATSTTAAASTATGTSSAQGAAATTAAAKSGAEKLVSGVVGVMALVGALMMVV